MKKYEISGKDTVVVTVNGMVFEATGEKIADILGVMSEAKAVAEDAIAPQETITTEPDADVIDLDAATQRESLEDYEKREETTGY